METGLTERDTQAQIDTATLRTSVVIPTYNRCVSLERVLRALARQTVSPAWFEVVLVADGCTDDTVPLCRRLANELPYSLRLIEQVNSGPAAARNRGVAEARAELIVFIDDDVVPAPEFLATHLAAHSTEGDSIIALGPLRPPPDVRLNAWGAWEEHALLQQYTAMEAGRWKPTYRQFYTGNASLWRRHILAAGGFHPEFLRAEDIELGLRLKATGCTFMFLPQARGWHYVHRTFASWTRMPAAYGRASVEIARLRDPSEIANIVCEFHWRNRLTRILARLSVGQNLTIRMATYVLRALANTAWVAHIDPAAMAACGLLFNLLNYHAIAEALGGRAQFWRLIDAGYVARNDSAAFERLLALTGEMVRAPGAEPVAHEPAGARV